VELYEGDDLEPLMELAVKGGVCAFEKEVKAGKAVLIGTDYICHLKAIRKLMTHLGVEPKLSHNCEYHGIVMGMNRDEKTNEKFLHVLNIDGFTKVCHLYYNGVALFEGREMYLGSRDGYMLPIDLKVGERTIVYSTAELYHCEESRIRFRLTQPQDVIVFAGEISVKPSEDYDVIYKDKRTYIYSKSDGRIEEFVTVCFA